MHTRINAINRHTCQAYGLSALTLPVVLATLLSGCAGTPFDWRPSTAPAPSGVTLPVTRQAPQAAAAPAPQAPLPGADEPQPAAAEKQSAIYRGTGHFINSTAAARTPQAAIQDGDLVLNFQETDIREVAKVVLGDMLNANYLIEPDVKGTVSLQTSRPVNSDALLPLFEKMLWMSDAVLIEDAGLYRIVKRAGATRGAGAPRLAGSRRQAGPGYGTYVVPLKFVAVEEMRKILEPFVSEGAILSVDERRNLMILAGTSQELEGWLETVEIFDVDWMKGNSVGLFELDYVEPGRIIDELEQILNLQADGEAASLIRLEPIDRLNAVLAITPQPRYLDKVRTWVERLDQAEGGPGTRLYVYRVRNRKASDLATVLSAMFEEGQQGNQAPARLAPGAVPATLRSRQSSAALPALGSADSGDTFASKERLATRTPPSGTEGAPADDGGVLLPETSSVRIMADELNNSIVIMATSTEFKIVEAALEKLDIVPLQVLIEASIVEVTLTDDLRYGVEWFFKNNNVQGDKTGIGTLDLGAAGIAARVPGFSYALVDTVGDVRAVLNMLAEKSDLNVLSSPSLLVLDNRTAEIRVGNQVPVQTETAVTEGGVTVESIQFKDTGVLLTVTPGVNSGGLVTMDVRQEVTDVGPIDAATGQRTFLQRNIQSVVAVQSEETVILGGLIIENESNAEGGVPGLYKIPGLGKLFGQTEQTSTRTELLVLITPRVIRNQEEALGVTEEFRQRMKSIKKWPFSDAPPGVEETAQSQQAPETATP